MGGVHIFHNVFQHLSQKQEQKRDSELCVWLMTNIDTPCLWQLWLKFGLLSVQVRTASFQGWFRLLTRVLKGDDSWAGQLAGLLAGWLTAPFRDPPRDRLWGWAFRWVSIRRRFTTRPTTESKQTKRHTASLLVVWLVGAMLAKIRI